MSSDGGRRRSVRRSLNPPTEVQEPAREVGRGAKPMMRNRLGMKALLLVPDSRPVNYVVSHLLDGEPWTSEIQASYKLACPEPIEATALDDAKRRAAVVMAKMSRIQRLHRRTFILPPNRTLVTSASGERPYNPLLASVPTLARAEEVVLGAGNFAVGAAAGAVEAAAGAVWEAAGAMKETVKRSNHVLKEFHKAVVADEADDDEDFVPISHARSLHEGRERAALRRMGPQDLGLALLPGWPTADMRQFSAIKARSAICAAVELPLMPPVPHRRLSQTLRAADAHDARKAGNPSSFSEYSGSAGMRASGGFDGFVSESQKKLQQLNTSATLFVEETQHLASRTVGKLGQVADIAGKAMVNLKNAVQTGTVAYTRGV
eukprot:s2247_g2.t1